MTRRPSQKTGSSAASLLVMAAGAPAIVAILAVLAVVAGVMAVVGSVGTVQAGCGPAGTGQQIAGTTLDAEQMGNAAVIVGVAARRGLPSYAAVVAVATAVQESSLRNVTHGDAAGPDSAGLFQQRPSAGWGTRTQVLDPEYAAGAFLDRLVQVPEWQTVPLDQAAQAVQNSARQSAYARWQSLAATIVGTLWPRAAATLATLPAGTRAGAGASPGASPRAGAGESAQPVVCPGAGGDTGARAVGATELPAGLEITGSVTAQIAVRFALAQLGKPYRWAAAGPDAYDCSGLTMTAWAAAGVTLTHYAGSQVRAGTPVPLDLSQATGGDLIFIPGSDGTPSAPGHVGMIAGRVRGSGGSPGQLYLVQAPRTGKPVSLTPVSAWAGQIVAVRHLA